MTGSQNKALWTVHRLFGGVFRSWYGFGVNRTDWQERRSLPQQGDIYPPFTEEQKLGWAAETLRDIGQWRRAFLRVPPNRYHHSRHRL